MTTPDLARVIEKAIAIRDKRAAVKAEWEAKDRVYREALGKLSSFASVLLGNAQSTKTEFGTAYRTETTHATVVDREAWLDFVWETGNRDFLTTHVNNTAVEEWMEKNGPAPGLELTFMKKVNFRRS